MESNNLLNYTDDRYPPKPLNAPIELIYENTIKPHIKIGEVTAYADVPLFGMPEPKNAMDKVKKMAREMGGDAIINFKGHRAPVGTVGAGGYSVNGIVVRWK